MSSILHELGRPALLSLSEALAAGRFSPPFPLSELRHHVPASLKADVVAELQEMEASGMQSAHIARLLQAMATERASVQAVADRVELVWSNAAELGQVTRDTAVVVQELFRDARKSVLISSFALDKGKKADVLFGPLAERLDAGPDVDTGMSVRLFVNVQRKYGDDTPESILLRRWAETFRDEIWPGERLPEVFYDPRALSLNMKERACLHAKCIVIDDERAFISSANFTEAAQERNIEAGLVIRDRQVALRLRSQFDALVERGVLRGIACNP